MSTSGFDLFEDRRTNAVLSWVLVVFLGLVAAAELAAGDLLWAGFAAFVLVLALLPAASYASPWVMLPWEVLALAALPVIGRAFATQQLTSDLATYLSVAALALVVAVELTAFTTVRMNYGFAVLFVVVATLATAGVWAVVRWLADANVGTAFLESEEALMWEFVYSTVAGLVAGVVFEVYFRRRARATDRIPEDVAEELTERVR